MKRGLTYVFAVLSIMCVIAIGIVLKNKYFENDSSFDIPKKTRLAIVLSSGAAEREKSYIYYYDSEGNEIKHTHFPYIACRNAIEKDDNDKSYNFFTHDRIYCQNGAVLNNEEMMDEYSFATKNAVDEVYSSGYMKSWNKEYKLIPHGLAYKISEYGAFDILTVYDSEQIENIRIPEYSKLACKNDESSIYLFSKCDDNQDKIQYERIIQNGKDYDSDTNVIDLSGAENKEYVWDLISAYWIDNNLYILTTQGEGDGKYVAMCHFINSNNGIIYKDSAKLDQKSLGVEGDYSIPPMTVSKVDGSKIKYYCDFSLYDYPGIITFDAQKNEFSIKRYDHPVGALDELISQYRVIGDDTYIAHEVEYDPNRMHIYKLDENDEEIELMSIKEPDLNMYLQDFYIFD